MRRAAALVLSAIVTLPLVSSAAASAASAQKTGPGVTVRFKLKTSNGLKARVETTGRMVDLLISGRHQFVGYRVKGTVSERRIKARFGDLGRIAVRFSKAGTGIPPSSKGCGGLINGVFVGAIEFRGERDYVRIDATSANGNVRIHRPKCPGYERLGPRPNPGVTAEDERVVATLTANAGGRQFRVAGFREPDGSGEASFGGSVVERRGAMLIGRTALARAPISAFSFDHLQRTATVQPPSPFSGAATFERHADGSKTWAGELSVALLGIDPVAFAGPAFHASLRPEFDD